MQITTVILILSFRDRSFRGLYGIHAQIRTYVTYRVREIFAFVEKLASNVNAWKQDLIEIT